MSSVAYRHWKVVMSLDVDVPVIETISTTFLVFQGTSRRNRGLLPVAVGLEPFVDTILVVLELDCVVLVAEVVKQ